MNRLAVITSGDDAPGMNAAIRAAVRSGVSLGFEMFGIRHGYSGLIAGDFQPLGARDVGGIIELGGTTLGTSRCPAFLTEAGQETAVRQLMQRDISGVVVIGGNGSQSGACALSQRGIAVERMKLHGVRRIPVVDETSKVVGILSLDDLLRGLAADAASLAEVVAREQDREHRTRR